MHLCFILSKPAKPSIFKLVQLGEQAVYTKDSKSYGLLPVTVYNNCRSKFTTIRQVVRSLQRVESRRSLQQQLEDNGNSSLQEVSARLYHKELLTLK